MGKTILVVDDSRVQRTSVNFALSAAGYEIEEAENGRIGLEKLENLDREGRTPRLIISDLHMPEMDGIDFVKNVKRTRHRFLPILILTTENQNEKMMEGKQAGASGWLLKPFVTEQLLEVVRKFVRD